MMKFWTARFDEKWPAAITPTTGKSEPAWVTRAKALKAAQS